MKATMSSYRPSERSPLQQPRMVSVEALSQVSLPAGSPESSPRIKPLTPLEALKELASSNQNRKRRASFPHSFRSSIMMSGKTRIASVFDEPSEMLRKAVEAAASPAKKRRVENPDSLHELCRRGPQLTVEEVESALKTDPGAAGRPERLAVTNKNSNSQQQFCSTETTEAYEYPLNLALAYNCHRPILETLVKAAPQVVAQADGELSNALHVLLLHRPQDTESADMLVLQSPEIASFKDAQGNTALHLAVRQGAPFLMIKHLVLIYPPALLEANAQGQTPLEIALRDDVLCSQEATSYMWSQAQLQLQRC